MLKLWWPGRPDWTFPVRDDGSGGGEGRAESGADAPVVALRLIDEVIGKSGSTTESGGAGRSVLGRLVLGDNLDLVSSLLKEDGPRLDLVYLDPPFGTGKRRTGPKAAYRDDQVDERMVQRMWTMFRGLDGLLSDKGQVFVHVDWRACAWMRLLLDEVFGSRSFRNEIVWHYSSGGRPGGRRYARKWDCILWYAPGRKAVFHPERIARPRNVCPSCGQVVRQPNHMKRHRDPDGRVYRTIRSAGKHYRYYDDDPVAPPDVWVDISHIQQRSPERTGYPTQKPEALLERIIEAHSDPGDMVADLFCGSGTTLAVAHSMGRNWLGCDSSIEAVETSRDRLDQVVRNKGGAFRVEELVPTFDGTSSRGPDPVGGRR